MFCCFSHHHHITEGGSRTENVPSMKTGVIMDQSEQQGRQQDLREGPRPSYHHCVITTTGIELLPCLDTAGGEKQLSTEISTNSLSVPSEPGGVSRAPPAAGVVLATDEALGPMKRSSSALPVLSNATTSIEKKNGFNARPISERQGFVPVTFGFNKVGTVRTRKEECRWCSTFCVTIHFIIDTLMFSSFTHLSIIVIMPEHGCKGNEVEWVQHCSSPAPQLILNLDIWLTSPPWPLLIFLLIGIDSYPLQERLDIPHRELKLSIPKPAVHVIQSQLTTAQLATT